MVRGNFSTDKKKCKNITVLKKWKTKKDGTFKENFRDCSRKLPTQSVIEAEKI